MAFEVTATRRRPKTFAELAGQEFVSATLSASIQSGQTAHAYLFSGPRGCGKTSAARILAKALNCEKGAAAEPCGECPSCVEIARGGSLDVIEIDGASNTGVNDVRQIKDEVLFPPNASRYKIYIIDEVHMLSTSAFNALLKTIEEPPPYIVFIFATTELHKVPATIKSRCQQFAFKLIPIETIQELLRAACGELNIEAEDEALFWIARESTGSLRDAYTLFDQVASFSEGHIRTSLIREKLGLVGLDNLNALAETCARGDAGAALAALDAIIEAGVAIEQFVIDLAGYYRALLLIKCGITKESLLGYGAARFSQAALEAHSPAQLEKAVRVMLDLFRDIRYSVSPRFELETAVAKLAALQNWVSRGELGEAVRGLQEILGGGSAPLAAAPRSAPALHAGLPLPPQREVPPPATPPAPARWGQPSAPPAAAPKQSLAEGFQQRIAGGMFAPPPPASQTPPSTLQTPPAPSAPSSSPSPVPPPQTPPPYEPRAPELPPEIELVRKAFDGTVIKT